MAPRTASLPRAAARSLLVGALAIAGLSVPHGVASAVASAVVPAAVTDPASLVNPFIGTSNGANDFPGADSPFGMVQWSPDTSSRPAGGGYAYGDSSLTGYSLTHVPGPGDPVAGDFPILPSLGTVSTTANATFSHANESAQAGSYRLTTNDGIETELTTTTRSGMARFTFPATTQAANLIFKMGHSQAADSGVAFTYVSGDEVSGQETTGDFGGHSPLYTVYFDMVFDQPITAHGTDYVSFGTSGTAPTAVQAKVGLSYVSIADAKGNWQAENPSPTFDYATTQTKAHNAWNTALGRLAVSGGTAAQQTVFYTALYHSLLFPAVFSDSNGKYMGTDGKSVETVDAGHSAFYTTYSGWDIYRTQAQLTALAAPTVADDIAQSMVDIHTQSGQFPKWMLNNGESYDMAGDPADNILADYYAFGATNFDAATALKDMVAEATDTTGNNVRPGLAYLEQLGYLPNDGSYSSASPPHYYASASTTLEYASNDAAISFLAKALNDTADQTTFGNRAQDWRNLFDPATGFIQPRNRDGSWMSGFTTTGGWGYCCDSPSVYFAEGDSWQYTPMVPFNVQGLADAEGGDAKLSTFLDTDLSSFTGGSGHADLTNEPSLDIPWEYDYIGEPAKAQAAVRKIQDQVWTDAPGGLAGNDDLGTMSAWYVWSALGMYPETPGTADLALGSPLFPRVDITLPSGKTLTVKGDNAADNAPYVQSATWAAGTGGTAGAWNNAYVPTSALTGGGTLDFTLGTSAPSTAWASSPAAAPPSYQGSATFNNAGISDDTAQAAANLDGSGNSYSAEALAKAGLTPGSAVTAGGLTFTWPGAASGSPDNYTANGQLLPLTGSGQISFLGSATNGPSTGTATVTYTDGTTQAVPITLSDWTLNGGTATASSGNTTVATATYRNKAGGTSQTINTYVFATAPITLAAGKFVQSVTLPSKASSGALHIFAVATQTGQTGGDKTGPIGSAIGSGLCMDDYHSVTTNGNLVDVHSCNGTAAQSWTENTVSSTLTVFGKCLDITGGQSVTGSPVEIWDCDGGGNQVWKPGANESLVNPASGLCLDDPGASTAGARLQINTCNGSAEQKWLLP